MLKRFPIHLPKGFSADTPYHTALDAEIHLPRYGSTRYTFVKGFGGAQIHLPEEVLGHPIRPAKRVVVVNRRLVPALLSAAAAATATTTTTTTTTTSSPAALQNYVI